MRKGKRLVSILLAFCMAFGLLPIAAQGANGVFTDVRKTDWFYEAVQYVYSHGLMKGTGADTFSPDVTTTRGMIVTILWRLEEEPAVQGTQFQDVAEDAYYAEAIRWAAENRIVTGYGSNRFGPDDPITREQLAAILYHYAQYKELDTSASDSLKGFTDASKISPYAKEAMGWACAVGLLQGSHNALNPQGNATRAQVATILYRFITTDFEEKKPDRSTGSSGTPVIPDRPDDPEEPEKTFEIDFNGEKVKIQEPVVIGDTMYIALKDILELFGYEYFWVVEYDTAVALRNGKVLRFYIDSTEAEKDGETIRLPSAPVICDGVPVIAAGALDALLGCTTTCEVETMDLSMEGSVPALIDYYLADSFGELGTWHRDGVYLQGTSVESSETRPAVLEVLVKKSGTYRLWVNARDFSTNQPGTRYFHASVDGVLSTVTFGQHGQDGFQWTDGGTFELEAGIHRIELLDSSCFYARCSGIILSQDLNFVPTSDAEMKDTVKPYDPFAPLVTPVFPEWAKKDVATSETAKIENDFVKVIFYEGVSAENGKELVQNEISIKDGESWVTVKQKTEELGYLMLDATSSEYVGVESEIVSNLQTFDLGGKKVSMATKNFYKSGNSTWFIPSGMEQVDEDTVKLTFMPNHKANLEVVFSLEADAKEPKVTLNAKFQKDGAYSFLLYSGDAVAYEDFERVTAPLLYVKKAFPQGIGGVTAECFMFTPMSTFTYKKGGNKLTSGIVVDPSEITMEDNYSYPDTSKFGFTFQNTDGLYRNQLVAPMFGTEHCRFQAGETYSFSFHLVNRCEDWFDTFQYVTEEMYKLSDVRENYHSSINEAIYNATDLMLNDDYGGWDDNAMSFYNMENQDLVTMGNPLEILQRYLLTEDETWLEERVIPTLAYSLSRPSYHSLPTAQSGGVYVPEGGPTFVGSPMAQFGTNVYGGLYEMTQGRVPYLLDYAVSNVKVEANLSGINSMIAMYKYTNNETYKKKLIELADRYLLNNPIKRMNIAFVDGFVYGDYINTATAFTNAYEATGKMEYLNAAKECAELLMTGLWTTGYQNDRLTTNYTISPADTMERLMNCDANHAKFWWHGSQVWRLGNKDGYALKPQDLDLKIREETVPAWLLAKAGMGTEHTRTPGHGNVITMNNWVGTLQRLASYTGEDYFEMQARNATLGRYSNYAGYYQDRNIVHQMEANYPYTGPDYTLIYWHHLPIFVAMLEDYLINSVWTKSNGNIEFPSINQNGYAYFASSQYGQEAGKFYDQDGMWLWLDRGIVKLENVNLDYIAARKNGVLGLAFVNEANETATTTISLGEKVPGGSSFNGTATVYDAAGTKSNVAVTNGSFTLTIPSKEIRSVVLNIPGVKTPGYVREYTYSNKLGDTYQTFDNARAHVLQMTDENYFAYVYTTLKADTVSKLTVEYAYGEVTGTAEDTEYPFEAIIKVTDPDAAFTYKMTVTKLDGSTEVLGNGVLKTMTSGASGVKVPGSTEDACKPAIDLSHTEAFKIPVVSSGSTGHDVRLVTNQADYPDAIQKNFNADVLAGMKIYAVFRHKTTGEIKILNTVVQSNTVRVQNGIPQAIVVCDETSAVPAGDYSNYYIEFAMCGSDCDTDLSALFDLVEQDHPFQMKLLSQSADSGSVRFTVLKKDFFCNTTADGLTGMLLNVELVSASGEERCVQTQITAAEVGTDSVTLTIAASAIGANESVVRLALKPVLMPSVVTTGTAAQLRIVTKNTDYTLLPSNGQLKDFRVYAKFIDKATQEVVRLDTTVLANESRAWDGNVTISVNGPEGYELSEMSGWTPENHDMVLAMAEADNPTDLRAIVEAALPDPVDKDPIQLSCVGQGSGAVGELPVFRFVVSTEENREFAVADSLKDKWLEVQFIPKNSVSETLHFSGRILTNEARSDGNTTILIPGTGAVPPGVYSNSYSIKLTLHPEFDAGAFDKKEFEPLDLCVVKIGQGGTGEEFRFVVAKSHIPFDAVAGTMNGLKLRVIFTPKSGGEALTLTGNIVRNEDRPAEPGNTTIVMAQTDTVKFSDVSYSTHTIRMILEPAR